MSDGDPSPAPSAAAVTQIFLLVTIGGSLVAFDLGYDLGALGTINYRRIFPIFVISTVALVASFFTDGPEVTDARLTRIILALPALYLAADVAHFTNERAVYLTMGAAVVVALPFTAYIVARMVDLDLFRLPRRLQMVAAATLAAMFLAGLYVGTNHTRFVQCTDFELAGDYVPENCSVWDS